MLLAFIAAEGTNGTSQLPDISQSHTEKHATQRPAGPLLRNFPTALFSLRADVVASFGLHSSGVFCLLYLREARLRRMGLLFHIFTLVIGLPATILALALPLLSIEQNQDEGCTKTHGSHELGIEIQRGTQRFKEVFIALCDTSLGNSPQHRK